ncbi:MAG: patatin-like phospholipase family protein [Chloroflexales bacterium]|nr:patatin-like phospholipase family protein [Chloroflexales bacterium]
MPSLKKALVLSGGGGRGAYHVGVLRYLVESGWMEDGVGPEIIAGTSIGAINAAAIASGRTVADMEAAWLRMHTEDVHRLSDDLPALSKPFLRWILRSVLTSETHGGGGGDLPAEERALSMQGIGERLRNLFQTRPFRSLLSTAPWRATLSAWMDFERINSPAAPALLLAATELRTGALRIFCNRPHDGSPSEQLTIDHLMASSSIPIVYPWTTIDTHYYWDGAVLANTPLDPVISLAGDSDCDILVVMMTPWHADSPAALPAPSNMPQDLVQALTLTLDWALLASYRAAFQALEMRNRLAEAATRLELAARMLTDDTLRMTGAIPRPITLPTVIAPQQFMPLEWIIDYEEANHRQLFELGYADAKRTLAGREER